MTTSIDLAQQVSMLRQENEHLRSQLVQLQQEQACLQAEQERVAELAKANEALTGASERLANQPDLSAFLSYIALEVIAQLGADAAMLSILDEQRQVLRAVAHVEKEDIPVSTLAVEIPIDEAGFVEVLLETRRPRYFNLEQEAHLFWQGAIEYHHQRNHKAVMGVPLFAGGNFLGHLGLAFTHTDPVKEQGSELLYALAQLAALAIQLTQLAEEAKQAAIAREQEKAAQERAAELAKANDVLGRSLNRLANDRNLNSFLEHVLQEALQMLDGAIAQFFIYDSKADTLMPSVAVDLHGDVLPAPGLMDNLPISGSFPATITKAWERMLNQRSPIYLDLIRDADDHWPGTLDWHRRMGHCGSICTALMMGDQPLGMLGLALWGRSEFTASEFEFFQALAQQATLAIQLTQLAEEAKQAAIAREQGRVALERAAVLEQVNFVLQQSIERLSAATNPRAVIIETLRTAAEVLASLGVNGIGLIRYQPTSRTVRVIAHLVEGVEQAITGNDLDADWLVDSPAMVVPWQRIQSEDFVWGLTSDTDVLIAEVRQYHESRGSRAIAYVPLRRGKETTGWIGFNLTSEISPTQKQVEMIRMLTSQVVLATEMERLAEEAKQAAIAEERNRIACDIHDTLAQAFTAISIQLDLAKVLDRNTPPAACQAICRASQLAETGLAEARRSVWALQPDAAQYQDLVAVLRRSLDHMTVGTSLQAEMDVQGTPYSVAPEVGMNLLRISQEAVNNALRHAEAGMILVELHYQPDQLMLRIQDDGKGFDPSQQNDCGGFGLLSMQQRAKRLNGLCVICSQPGGGTEIFVQVPIVPTGGNE